MSDTALQLNFKNSNQISILKKLIFLHFSKKNTPIILLFTIIIIIVQKILLELTFAIRIQFYYSNKSYTYATSLFYVLVTSNYDMIWFKITSIQTPLDTIYTREKS